MQFVVGKRTIHWETVRSIYVCIMLCVVVFLIGQPLFAYNIKVVTFNIRYDSGRDGVNSWQNRKEHMRKFLLKQDADIICLQEVLHHQYIYLAEYMESYDVIGNGRNDGKEKGEYAPILYLRAKYELIEKGQFWLSEHPSVIGSIGWDAKQPRIVTWVKLRNKKTGKPFMVMNTHFDDIGKEARRKSVDLIFERISSLSVPVILTGDFNENPTSALYKKLSDNLNGIKDVHTFAKTHKGVNYTFHGFGKIQQGQRNKIDYIFVKGIKKVKSENIFREKIENNVYLSDHNPIMAVLSL